MKFVLIFGPQAVGKMTVGQELSKITDLREASYFANFINSRQFRFFSSNVKKLKDKISILQSIHCQSGFYITQSQYGYTESAILYLTGVLAAGLFWIGRK